jgi:hypothetical protein
MSHVVMQAAELPTIDAAAQAEAELRQLFEEYVAFEKHAENPWSADVVPPPLVALGQRHGVPWPGDKHSRFLLKGGFDESAEVLRVDRLLFFFGGGFDLGGAWLREVLGKMGAVASTERPFVVVRAADPQARATESSEFLAEEDHEDQFSVTSDDGDLDDALFAITFESDGARVHLCFDDSGVQDWAFVALLPQLSGDDPALRAERSGADD